MARRGDQSRGGAVRLQPTFGPMPDSSRSVALPKFRKPPKLAPYVPRAGGDSCGPGADDTEPIILPPPPPEIVGFTKASTPVSQTIDSTGVLTIPVPDGVQDGDLLFAWIKINAVVPPAEWTYVDGPVSNVSLWEHTALSEPADYTWMGSIASRGGCMVAVRGGVLGNFDSTNAGSGLMICPSISTGVFPGALWFGFGRCDDSDNVENLTVSGSHALLVQHVSKSSALAPAATGISVQSGLTAGETVSGNQFINASPSSSRGTTAIIINPS